jgi:hypothetical protein
MNETTILKRIWTVIAVVLRSVASVLGGMIKDLLSDRTLSLIAIGAITALALYFASTCSGPIQDKDAEFEKKMQVWKDSTKLLIQHKDSVEKVVFIAKSSADSLVADAAKKDTAIRKLNNRVVKLQHTADSLYSAAKTDTSTCINLCGKWHVAADSLKVVVDSQAVIINQDSVRYAEQVEAYKKLGIAFTTTIHLTDSLSRRLETVPTYKKEKFLGLFPMPSRTTSFVVGTAVGIIGTVFIISKTH